MEKRVFFAIFLSFLVLALYQSYFAPQPAPLTDPAKAPAGTPAATPGQPAAGPAPTAPAPAAAPVEITPSDPASRDIVVETDTVRAVFTTGGATLKSWRLKEYLDGQQQPLELVPSDVPGPRPFTLSTDDLAQSTTLAAAVYQPSAEGLSIGSATGTLTFQYRDGSGLRAEKRFYFQPDGKKYVVNVEATVEVNGAAKAVTIHGGPGIGLGYSFDGSIPPRTVQMRDGKVERLTAADLQAQPRYEGEVRFAGVEDQFFVTTAVPAGERARVEYRPIDLPAPGNPAGPTRSFIAYSVTPNAGATPSRAVTLPFFIGPKKIDVLSAVDPRLENAIDFGMFAWLVRPLLRALNWINNFLGNYGWSIVALTILINVAIFPLRHRSMVSMRKMQALQPEIKAIQDRYAKYKLTDPERQKMNQEMMGLYKQKGVNPASGCLPMLLTMPILFAFYAMLSVAIELRGAPFFGWIHDLSVKDPYYITPVVMGATMFWQQWLTPTTADPTQKKIFMLMPIIFTFTFLAFPAGLVIYWLVSNLMAIGQQLLTNKLLGPPPQMRPAVAKPAPAPAGKPSRKGQS
jgi:YidC/Oxa1 family membrane protein insertase